MKNKKGFTLIILNMIENAKKGAARDTAYGYIDAIEYNNGFADIESKGYTMIPDNDDEKEFYTVEEINEYNIKYRGKGPDSGVVTIKKRKVYSASLCIGKYKVDYNGKEATVEKSNECTGVPGDEEESEVIVPDEHPCELATETKDNKEYYYIDSAEDLYKFSESVNGGNDYSGKIVQLRNNIDLSEYTSDKKTKVCTDGDNANGFTPIGNGDKPFKGTFEGHGKTISNLTIDRPSSNYVGLFGYAHSATIYGLNLDNIKYHGRTYVGGVAGAIYSTTIKEMVLSNIDIEGSSYVGGVTSTSSGTSSATSTVNNIIVSSGKVKSGDRPASAFVPSTAYSNNGSVIVGNVTVTAGGNGADSGIISGNWGSYSNGYYSNQAVYNGSQLTSGFNAEDANDLNFYELAGFDTWIGGDNDGSKYYFDYNKTGEIVIKATEVSPIPININKTLQKSGDYYLIKSEKDWKKATAFINDSVKFKITKNLDFKKNKFYMMGGNGTDNSFNGTLEGGAKTISNVTINASKVYYSGILGYAKEAKALGIHLKNIKVTGNQYVGSLAGLVDSTKTQEIILEKIDIKGNAYVGGLIGRTTGSSEKPSEVDGVIVRGATIVGGDRPTSAFVPSTGSTTNKNVIVESATVTAGGNANDSGIIAGHESWGRYSNGLYSNTCVYNGNITTGGFDSTKDTNDLNFYELVGLDTWIAGDDNKNGYYFDYDSTGKNVILKSVEDDPIPTNLDDTFEKDEKNHYLIEDEEDWKNATAFATKSPKFKLTGNLDFENKPFYMMGGDDNFFNGTFNGGAKVISNVTVNASKSNCVGVFSYPQGAEIYGLNLNNIKMIGKQHVGGVAGAAYSTTIREIAINNVDLKGNSYIGGITSTTSGTAQKSGSINNIVVKNATIVGGDRPTSAFVPSTGSYNSNSNVIVEHATVTAGGNGADSGIITGYWGSCSAGYYSNACVYNGNTTTNGFASSNINNLNYYKDKVETMYNGDQNNTGYFFDYIDNEVFVVKAYTTTNGSTSSTAVVTHTNSSGSDTTAPTCTLNHVIVINNGFEYSFSCTDETEIDKITSLFDHDPYNGQYDSSSFNTIGTIKNGTISNSNKTSSYTSRWTTANSNPPSKGTCYYFSYGGEDKAGNYSVYHTDNCYQY